MGEVSASPILTSMLTTTPYKSFKRTLANIVYKSGLPGSQRLARFIYGKNGVISEFVKPDQELKEFIKWKRTKLQDLIHLNFWLRSFSTSNKADQFRLFHFYLIGKELNNWEQVDISFSKLVTSKEEFKILFEIICSIPFLKPTKEDFQQKEGLHLKTEQKKESILEAYVRKVIEEYKSLLPHAWPKSILEEHFKNLLKDSNYIKNFKG